jgi:hypothetical protein
MKSIRITAPNRDNPNWIITSPEHPKMEKKCYSYQGVTEELAKIFKRLENLHEQKEKLESTFAFVHDECTKPNSPDGLLQLRDALRDALDRFNDIYDLPE